MEYCTCKSPPGYLSLRDEHNTFVCGSCLKPAYLVWLASERFCEECDCSIYTRWALICSSCQTALLDLRTDLQTDGVSLDQWPPILTGTQLDRPLVTWRRAAETSVSTWPWRWQSHETSSK
jgi:hypothetical protein